jgi:hypothetical protein
MIFFHPTPFFNYKKAENGLMARFPLIISITFAKRIFPVYPLVSLYRVSDAFYIFSGTFPPGRPNPQVSACQ